MTFSVINGLHLSVPPELEGIVPVSPCAADFPFEIETFRGLKACIAPGDTVIDVGASYGVMTTIMAILAGSGGRVISVEPNQEAQALARQLVSCNSWNAPVEFINAMAGDAVGVADFYLVPGTRSVASTRNADIRYFHGDCAMLELPMITLDDLKLKSVSTIKVDVEGSEYAVLRGATRLMGAQHPRFVIETHGPEIDGIAGDLRQLCSLLVDSGYQLWDLTLNRFTATEEYSERYRHRIGYLLAACSFEEIQLT